MYLHTHTHTHTHTYVCNTQTLDLIIHHFTESNKHVVGNASERGLRRGGKKPSTVTGEGGIHVHTHSHICM